MLFHRAAKREFSQTAATVFVALFAILLTTQLIRLLGQAAGGKIASEGVIALLGFGAINYLPTLLSLTLFISVLMTMSRAYRDSEMAIWFSAGMPLTAWVRPVLSFALPLVVLVGVLSIFLSPWALTKSAEYRQRMDDRDGHAFPRTERKICDAPLGLRAPIGVCRNLDFAETVCFGSGGGHFLRPKSTVTTFEPSSTGATTGRSFSAGSCSRIASSSIWA